MTPMGLLPSGRHCGGVVPAPKAVLGPIQQQPKHRTQEFELTWKTLQSGRNLIQNPLTLNPQDDRALPDKEQVPITLQAYGI